MFKQIKKVMGGNEVKKDYIVILSLIVLGLGLRLLPHSPNFTPVGAIALFSGLYLSRKLAFVVPMILMFISDLLIGFYHFPVMISVYLSFALMVGIGSFVKKRKNVKNILFGTLFGSVAFFIVTNGAVWLFASMYSKDISGLMLCYEMALPFFRNTLFSNIFYSGVLVGGMELVLYFMKLKSLNGLFPVKVKRD